jgi:formiminoglutamase
MTDLLDFLSPVDKFLLNEDEGYNDGQLSQFIRTYHQEMPDLDEADIVLVGVAEYRGEGNFKNDGMASANAIRKQLYLLHYWHSDIRIADIGNINTGATIADSYAAIKTVLTELIKMGKTTILLGGSHDVTLAQYNAYKSLNRYIEATCIDATIDLRPESHLRSENFLLEMLTSDPNWIKHYNHIGFQSYFVHPRMLETMDKLRFDCYRVGKVKENLDEVEPVIRNSHLLSLDINAIKYSDAPSTRCSPNGFTGEEACVLCRHAGMSSQLSSFGIYGYEAAQDSHELTARQIAQMLWYFIDGRHRRNQEAALKDRQMFNEFHTFFAEVDTLFLQSSRTGRWWMQLPNQTLVPCSYGDFLAAKNNDIPERWLRAQEREMSTPAANPAANKE